MSQKNETETNDRHRMFDVTVRAEVEAGHLTEWLAENVPPGMIVKIEEAEI